VPGRGLGEGACAWKRFRGGRVCLEEVSERHDDARERVAVAVPAARRRPIRVAGVVRVATGAVRPSQPHPAHGLPTTPEGAVSIHGACISSASTRAWLMTGMAGGGSRAELRVLEAAAVLAQDPKPARRHQRCHSRSGPFGATKKPPVSSLKNQLRLVIARSEPTTLPTLFEANQPPSQPCLKQTNHPPSPLRVQSPSLPRGTRRSTAARAGPVT
jgi:hypothetical protein